MGAPSNTLDFVITDVCIYIESYAVGRIASLSLLIAATCLVLGVSL